MNSTSKLAASVFGCMFLSVTIAQDKQALDEQRLTWAPFAIQDEMGMVIEPPVTDRLVVMNVRIINADGEVVHSWRSHGQLVTVDTTSLPDGNYRYEIVSAIDVSGEQAQGLHSDNEIAWRHFGRFQVTGGRTKYPDLEQRVQRAEAKLSSINTPPWPALALAVALDWLVSNAHAADLLASGQFRGQVNFRSHEVIDDDDWRLQATESSFRLIDRTQFSETSFTNSPVMTIEHAIAFPTSNSIYIQSNGDMSLGSFSFFLDRSNASMHLGSTSTPLSSIHISDPMPDILLEDISDNSAARIRMQANSFNIQMDPNNTQTYTNVLGIHRSAPESSMYIGSNGDINWGNGAAFLDRSAGELALGTTVTPADLTASSTIPDIRLMDSTDASEFEFQFNNGLMEFWTLPGGGVWKAWMNYDGDADTVGIFSPVNTDFKVQKENAQIVVESTDAGRNPRALLHLKNNGPVEVLFEDELFANNWVARAHGVNFRIYRQNAYDERMDINKNGNVSIGGVLSENSDRNAKQGIEPVIPELILEKVAALPVAHWQYTDDPDVEHIGPMAQDFHAAFGVGASDTGISTLDTSGVALAAIQALDERDEKLLEENRQLRAQNLSLEQRLHELESIVLKLVANADDGNHVAAR